MKEMMETLTPLAIKKMNCLSKLLCFFVCFCFFVLLFFWNRMKNSAVLVVAEEEVIRDAVLSKSQAYDR